MSMSKLTQENLKNPIFWCSFIVRRPRTAFGITFAWHLLILLATGILIAAGYNVFPSVLSDLPMQLRNEHSLALRRNLAWKRRFKAENDAEFVYRDQPPRKTPDSNSDFIHIIYKVEGGNIFTREKLFAMKKLEDELISYPEYIHFCQKKHCYDCQKNGTSTSIDNRISACVKPISILRFFDGTHSDVNQIFNDSDFKSITEVLNMANSLLPEQFLLNHLGVNSKIAKNEVFSDATRTTFHFNQSSDGTSRYEEFLLNYYESRLKSISLNGYKGMKVVYFGPTIYQLVRNQLLLHDVALAIGSFIFIFAFLYIQIRSLWITSFTVLSIFASFCGVNLIYRVILNYKYLGAFNALSLYIILGLGVNDIFVFFDTWKFEAAKNHPTLENRLSATFRRAAGSIFITSIITSLCFLVNAFSPLHGVRTFGVFAGTLVMYNYFSVITCFPAIILTHHLWWNHSCRSKPTRKKFPKVDIETPAIEKSLLVKFLGGPYFRFITHNLTRMCLLVIFVSILSWFAYTATCLQSQTTRVTTFKSSNRFSRYFEEERCSFRLNENQETVTVYIVWGLEPQKMENCHKSDYECVGTTVYDKNFDLNPAPSQLALLNFCQKLKDLPPEVVSRLHIKRDLTTNKIYVNCFMSSFHTFLKEEEKLSLYTNYTNSLKLPTSEVKAQIIMKANPEIFGPTPDNYYRYFEVELAYWLTNRFGSAPASNHHLSTQVPAFSGMLGAVRVASDTLCTKEGHLYGTHLKFAAIAINTTLIFDHLSLEKGISIEKEWEKFVSQEMTNMPPTIKNGFQLSDGGGVNWGAWHWFKILKGLADSAKNCITYGLILSLLLLIMGTGNLIVGLISTFTIALTTVCIVGFIPMAEWKIGLLESLNLTIVVGLSVGYVAHLAKAYCMSEYDDRLHRVQDMLERLGPSIVSGALTILGASIFMSFTEMQLISQFGVFTLCITGFSLLNSLVLFTLIVGIIGPQKEFCSLKSICLFVAKRKQTGRATECSKCSGKGYYSIASDSASTKITCCQSQESNKTQLNAEMNEENMPLTNNCDYDVSKNLYEWRISVL